MIKTIKVGTKEIVLNNNLGWTFIYKDQFGHDIIPTLMPMAGAILDIIGAIVQEVGAKKKFDVEDLGKVTDSYKMMDAIAHLSGLEFVEIINIIWALAKNADDSLPEPKKWLQEFEEFPLDEILPEAVPMILKGVMSSKNVERLQMMIKNLEPMKKSKSTSKK